MRPICLLLFLAPGILSATPGSLIESTFPNFSAQATVSAAAISDDGSVFVSGDFNAADGTPRPGLAKLTPSGLLDTAFNPTPDPSPPIGGGVPVFSSFGLGDQSPPLFALPQGRLMTLHGDSWTLYDSDGSQNETLLSDISRSGTPVPRPQFLTDERLFLINGTEPGLQAYCVDDLSADTTFTAATGPHPAHQAAPANSSGIWVLGRGLFRDPPYLFNSYPFTIFRLEENGDLDPSFEPVELPEGYEYHLSARADGGFNLVREWTGRYLLSPIATSRSLVAEQFDTEGESLGTSTFSLPFSLNLAAATLQSPNHVIRPTLDLRRIIRTQPGEIGSDPSFSIALAAPELPALNPLITKTVTQFPNGQLLVGGNRKFSSEGVPDPAWHTPRLSKKSKITKLRRLPGNGVIVCGDFDLVDGTPAAGMVRLTSDDSIDPSFTPDLDCRFLQDIQSLPNGNLAARFSIPVPNAEPSWSELVRLTPNGSLSTILPEPISGSASIYWGRITDFTVRSDGSIVAQFHQQGGDLPTSNPLLINPDGSLSFPNPLGFLSSYNQPSVGLLSLRDDTFFRGSERYSGDGTLIEAAKPLEYSNPKLELDDGSVIFTRQFFYTSVPTIQRWHPESGYDADFVDPFPSPSTINIGGVTPASSDKLLAWGNFPSASLIRLHSSGQIDPSFRTPSTPITTALAEPGNTILAATNGELIRLDDSQAVGFDDWIEATSVTEEISPNDLLPDADPDHDGCSNFLEYAASSDPFVSDSSRCHPVQIAPLTWRIFCNPEAPEISRRIETTTNCSTWGPARSDQVRLETNSACLSWTLLPGQAKLFSRVRID